MSSLTTFEKGNGDYRVFSCPCLDRAISPHPYYDRSGGIYYTSSNFKKYLERHVNYAKSIESSALIFINNDYIMFLIAIFARTNARKVEFFL